MWAGFGKLEPGWALQALRCHAPCLVGRPGSNSFLSTAVPGPRAGAIPALTQKRTPCACARVAQGQRGHPLSAVLSGAPEPGTPAFLCPMAPGGGGGAGCVFPFLEPVLSLQVTSCCSVPWTLAAAPTPLSSVKVTETCQPASWTYVSKRGQRPPRAGGTELYRTGSVTCILAPEVFCGLDLSWVGVAHTDSHLRAFAHIVPSPGVTPLCPPFIRASNYDPPFILICTEVPG